MVTSFRQQQKNGDRLTGAIVSMANRPGRRRLTQGIRPWVNAGGISRVHGYGFEVQDFLARANDEVVVTVEAEHAPALDEIDAITATPGLDAVFVGAYDLSASLGKMGQVENPGGIVDRVTAACRQNLNRVFLAPVVELCGLMLTVAIHSLQSLPAPRYRVRPLAIC